MGLEDHLHADAVDTGGTDIRGFHGLKTCSKWTVLHSPLVRNLNKAESYQSRM